MNENKTYTIFSIHLSGYLMMNGQPIISIGDSNKNDKNKKVYFFNNTDKLHSLIEEYKLIYKK